MEPFFSKGRRVLTAGALLPNARAAMILLHGRGASPSDMLAAAAEWMRYDIAFLLPQAARNTWYPYSFLAPLEQNEPWLSSSLEEVADLLTRVQAAGMPPEKTILLGFSQGACLALEFAARNARRYGGIVGLTGGLIGPEDTPRDYVGSLEGTPVFLGCDDADYHVPKERVRLTAQVMERLGGRVTERLYKGMGHTINADESAFIRDLLESVAAAN